MFAWSSIFLMKTLDSCILVFTPLFLSAAALHNLNGRSLLNHCAYAGRSSSMYSLQADHIQLTLTFTITRISYTKSILFLKSDVTIATKPQVSIIYDVITTASIFFFVSVWGKEQQRIRRPSGQQTLICSKLWITVLLSCRWKTVSNSCHQNLAKSSLKLYGAPL